jgi:hypothetical protein
VGSLIAILLAGGAGGFAGWWAVHAMGWSGLPGALVAVLIAMVVALGVFAAMIVLSDRLRRRP